MTIKDILILLAVIVVAVFYLYRTIKKEKWCPDIYGTGGCSIEADQDKREKERDKD